MCAARIVLAEDDAELRQILATWLGIRWDVVAAADGQAAWEAIQEQRPDLIVCDIVMPKMNGLELTERIRSDPELADVPICMVTASTSGSDIGDAVWRMASDTDAFITKPFEPQELMAKVEALLLAAVARRRGEPGG